MNARRAAPIADQGERENHVARLFRRHEGADPGPSENEPIVHAQVDSCSRNMSHNAASTAERA